VGRRTGLRQGGSLEARELRGQRPVLGDESLDRFALVSDATFELLDAHD
jgi:hypothetical protein